MKNIFIIIYILISRIVVISQTFELIQNSEVVTDTGYSQGCAWGDYDNDGYLDFYVTNSWTNDDNLFYHNNGDGTFEKITTGYIANDGGNSNGCSWGDYNNDGYIDLFVANVNNQNNFLYKNNGDGSFLKDTVLVLTTDSGWSYGAAWADYDNDGYLDLYVANYYDQKNFLYHNKRDGTFEKITNGAIVNDEGNSQNAIWADLNNDGYLDLFVANMGLNCIYANNQNGTFTKITSGTIVTESRNSFGVSIADYNNDGLLDVYIAEWHSENSLYKNLGDFVFEKITTGDIVNEYSDTEGSAWGDYDNDGLKDLFITNDGINFLYKNNGDETFTKIDDINICTDGANSNGCSFTDYNNDGFVDLFIANGGNQTNLLYYNTKNENNWLKIKCVGVEHNMSAVGAKVAVLATINNQQVWQYQEVSAQSGGGYGSQNGFVLNFGLGNATKVDSIVVMWNNKINENFSETPINSYLTIVQNSDNLVKENNSNSTFINVYPNPFTEQVNFNYSLKNKSVVDMKIFTTDGKLVVHCVDNQIEMPGRYTVKLQRSNFKNDEVFVYIIKINNISYSGKIVLNK